MTIMKKLPIAGWIGGAIVCAVILMALVSWVWTPYDPLHAYPEVRLQSSSLQHWLGTDRFGRDVLSQIMVGARITLAVGVVAVVVAAAIGVPLGMIAAMRRGTVEAIIMRSSDLLLAFPGLLLAIIATAMFGATTLTAMVGIGLANVPGFARISRAAALTVMSLDYVAAARTAKRGSLYIATRHVLPNITGVIIVQASVSFAQRVSTIRDADQIVVLDHGEVVGKGTHYQLMGSCAAYQEIVSSQLSKEEIAHV